MDLEQFLALERQRLREERERLTPRASETPLRSPTKSESRPQLSAPASGTPPSSDVRSTELFLHESPEQDTENACPSLADDQRFSDFVASVGATNAIAFLKNAKNWANQSEQNSARSLDVASGGGDVTPIDAEPVKPKPRCRKNQDDMEQWVTDTFYSYFPGFNNEYQKRQNLLQERQLENQQNFLKHQALYSPKKNARIRQHLANRDTETKARSSSTTTTTTTTSSSPAAAIQQQQQQQKYQQPHHSQHDKTDLEIIVNNPQIEKSQPSATRFKLLQDLKHTDLSTMPQADERFNSGAVLGRKRHKGELQLERQKEYQRELLKQIDDKRRSIEKVREKERREEEDSARRLQEQLKTLKLEEQLEKERARAEKVRFEAEHNRRMRENLIRKLEQDTKLLYAKQPPAISTRSKVTTRRGDDDNREKAQSDPSSSQSTANKVYQYFSNSARHEYRRGRPLPAEVEFQLDLPQSLNTEQECFHLSDKVCPLCDAPLRSYESCCLRCQRKLSLKLHVKKSTLQKAADNAAPSKADASKDDTASTREADKQNNRAPHKTTANGSVDDDNDAADDDDEDGGVERQTFSLVCVKCERLYTMCPTCVAKSDVCRACNRKRHVCMSCRRALCSFCLDEVACGRDSERTHINEADSAKKLHHHSHHHGKRDSSSERSFQILEMNFAKDSDDGEVSCSPLQLRNNHQSTMLGKPTGQTFDKIHNNLHSDSGDEQLKRQRPPYSMNIDRNSLFHPDFEVRPVAAAAVESPAFEQLPKLVDKHLSFDLDTSATDDPVTMERVRKETDKRLSRYLKNYGDLAAKPLERSQSESRHFGTQTTPDSLGRRDVVLNEEHNLSMPLLREMPKMTRKDAGSLMAKAVKNNQRKMENLNRRWEIPAVQKFTISQHSPKVLTQVGAIRKQLQAERLFAQSNTDDEDDDDY